MIIVTESTIVNLNKNFVNLTKSGSLVDTSMSGFCHSSISTFIDGLSTSLPTAVLSFHRFITCCCDLDGEKTCSRKSEFPPKN